MKNLLVLSTVPNAKVASGLAKVLVQEKLAACVNIVPGMTAVYRWKGKIEKSAELLLLIKTTSARYPALEKRIQSLHPYDVPEIVALPFIKCAASYLRWLQDSVR